MAGAPIGSGMPYLNTDTFLCHMFHAVDRIIQHAAMGVKVVAVLVFPLVMLWMWLWIR